MMRAAARPAPPRAGSVTIEFSLVLVLLLTLVLGVLELARAMYLFNALQDVTRRAAALAAQADFSDASAMDKVRQRALLRDSPGAMTWGAPVTDRHIRIDYLSLGNAAAPLILPIPAAALPACPANNQINCMRNPYGASCIRLVRARICDPAQAGACAHVRYQTMLSFIALPMDLPLATAITPAETLGAAAGAVPCP
jgi:hypothetical protein